jgi:hypothetical protein
MNNILPNSAELLHAVLAAVLVEVLVELLKLLAGGVA